MRQKEKKRESNEEKLKQNKEIINNDQKKIEEI